MSLYKVHIKWDGKDVVLRARQLDMTHPYFVSIKDLVFPKESKLIIDPAEETVRKTFGKADHLMIPFQTVALIEELSKEDAEQAGKVRNFTLIEGSGDRSKGESTTDSGSASKE